MLSVKVFMMFSGRARCLQIRFGVYAVSIWGSSPFTFLLWICACPKTLHSSHWSASQSELTSFSLLFTKWGIRSVPNKFEIPSTRVRFKVSSSRWVAFSGFLLNGSHKNSLPQNTETSLCFCLRESQKDHVLIRLAKGFDILEYSVIHMGPFVEVQTLVESWPQRSNLPQSAPGNFYKNLIAINMKVIHSHSL